MPREEEEDETKDMMIGVDLAKAVFQVHGALRTVLSQTFG